MRKTPDWHHQTHLERRRLAISLTESPIEALFAGELATSPSFGVCRTKPPQEEFSRGRIALVPQQPAGRFRIDIAAFLLDQNGKFHQIAIECDGHAWHSSPAQIARDTRRDEWLVAAGWCVWRYRGWAIHHHWADAVDEAEEAIRNLAVDNPVCHLWASSVNGQEPDRAKAARMYLERADDYERITGNRIERREHGDD